MKIGRYLKDMGIGMLVGGSLLYGAIKYSDSMKKEMNDYYNNKCEWIEMTTREINDKYGSVYGLWKKEHNTRPYQEFLSVLADSNENVLRETGKKSDVYWKSDLIYSYMEGYEELRVPHNLMQ